jgi:hypothetical protein
MNIDKFVIPNGGGLKFAITDVLPFSSYHCTFCEILYWGMRLKVDRLHLCVTARLNGRTALVKPVSGLSGEISSWRRLTGQDFPMGRYFVTPWIASQLGEIVTIQRDLKIVFMYGQSP